MPQRVAHDPLQRVKPPEDALVDGEDRSQPPVHGPGQEAVARAASEVASRPPSCQLSFTGSGGKRGQKKISQKKKK